MIRSLDHATVFIAGMGLMGGSLALALRGSAGRIVGSDVDLAALCAARTLDAVDETVKLDCCADWIRRTDLLVLSTPLGQMSRFLRTAAPHLRPGTVVTDLGGAKMKVIGEIEATLPAGVRYIPGHPMAGSEKRGISGADASLFRQAAWMVAEEPPALLAEMISAVGAELITIDAQMHDRVVAHTSHLPHMMAAATAFVCAEAAGDNEGAFQTLSAGGFRDTTRVCEGSPEMAADMCLYNTDELLPALERAGEILLDMSAALRGGDTDCLRSFLQDARDGRRRIVRDEQ